ncbi:hypothetical protein [Shewanella sp. ECSMB14101]|nr:hypothetical protein [Shewanella sp. ECSMB14101]
MKPLQLSKLLHRYAYRLREVDGREQGCWLQLVDHYADEMAVSDQLCC